MKPRRPRSACLPSHLHSTPNPNPSPQPVTEAPEQPIETAARKTNRPQRPEPKPTASPKPATGKSRKKAAASVNTAIAKSTTPNLVVPTQIYIYLLEEISEPLDRLPLQACVELTRRLLTSISLPTGADRPRSVLKTVIMFVGEYGSTPRRTEQCKSLRLACWNANGLRSRKLHLEHFLNQHDVDICLLSETFLDTGEAFRLANYVCLSTDRRTGGTAVQSWSFVL